MRNFFILLIFTAISMVYSADITLPVEVQKAVQSTEAEIAKARQLYEDAAQKSSDKLLIVLKKSQETATKKGDLDTALAIKQKIESIQKGELIASVDEKAKSQAGVDLLGSKIVTSVTNPEKYIIGTWTRADGRYSFGIQNDGTMNISWGTKPWKVGDKADAVGTWELFKHEGYVRLTYCGEYSDIALPLTTGDNKLVDNKIKAETTISKK